MTHLEALGSRPRPVGSAANHEGRRYCAEQLGLLGFEVTERPFEFSALPGRYAAQIIGTIAVVGFMAGHFLFSDGFALLTALAIVVVVFWLGGPDATRDSILRERGVNLEATRGADPRVWLVAHIDSKSQPIPSAVRALGVLGVAVGVLGLFLAPSLAVWAGTAGGVILLFASVGGASDGAADNASGVAAVLEAAALVDRSKPLGVLITDAEELALAGAREWVRTRPTKGFAVNCDTIDDQGKLTLIRYQLLGRPYEIPGKFADRVLLPIQLPGVLTDSNAFRAAGWETVTLGRGTIRTLNRIHTRRDSLDHLRGTAIPDAARVLARLVEEQA